ncbi:type IV secretory system conjugative DNA transfer family protein [Actinomadura kijaniata]|uniref:type IV secretory system conjugative DNA transfer family protein n=1 Tax=Actinomadura kijaniata TaxID=46161 RepID=UPI003F1CDAEB
MSAPRRRSGPPDFTPYLVLAGLGFLIVAATSLWTAGHLGHALAGDPAPTSANPINHLIYLATGQTKPPGTTTLIILGIEAVLIAVAAIAAGRRWRRRRTSRTRVDVAARHMANRNDLHAFSREGAAATAQRLGAQTSAPGIRVGRAVNTGAELFGTWEDMHVDIWGPRTGKTTSRAIPAILEAPGAVLATSNKRDIVDATRLPREQVGPVWVFDPQGVVGEEAAWWWDILSYVTDVDTAARLAAVFAAYGRDPGTRTDSYFDPEGETLLAWMLLAAAEGNEPITAVYRWLSDVTDATPVDLLSRAGHDLPAEHVQGVINMPDKQRGGIYGTARKSVNCLVNPAITQWVTPDPKRPDRPQFVPADFVRGQGTLYSLSREGRGTAGPLVTALTVATIEAAETYATASPGGRLPIPMVGVLDEAANVCRWKDLPDLYSHYGSRGIPLLTILQSWAQGVEVWGEHGIAKLWSAANIRVYGGGVSDSKFLGDLVAYVGEFEPVTYSTTVQSGRGAHSRSTSASTRPEKILDVADLFAMPRGRALVLPSGAPPVLVRTLPWQAGPHADKVKASLAKYAPRTDTAPTAPTVSPPDSSAPPLEAP